MIRKLFVISIEHLKYMALICAFISIIAVTTVAFKECERPKTNSDTIYKQQLDKRDSLRNGIEQKLLLDSNNIYSHIRN